MRRLDQARLIVLTSGGLRVDPVCGIVASSLFMLLLLFCDDCIGGVILETLSFIYVVKR